MTKRANVILRAVLLCATAVSMAPGTILADTSGRRSAPPWHHVWPSEAPFKEAFGANGTAEPGTGKNACCRFGWNGAGSWKIFPARKGVPLAILAWGDSGPGACLGHVQFTILERTDGEWAPRMSFVGPDWNGVKPDHEPGHRWVAYTPASDSIQIRADNFGFYVAVYARGKTPFADPDDRIQDRDLRGKCRELAQALLKESDAIGEGQVIPSLSAMAPLCVAELRGVPGLRGYVGNASGSKDEGVRAAAAKLLPLIR